MMNPKYLEELAAQRETALLMLSSGMVLSGRIEAADERVGHFHIRLDPERHPDLANQVWEIQLSAVIGIAVMG